MRDPARIPEVLEQLGAYWRANPDHRLGQIVENLTPRGESVFQVEDTTLLSALREANEAPLSS